MAEPRPEPTATSGFINTARGRVKQGDVDVAGHFALSAIVHRFSNASGQLGTAIGMDTAHMQQQRRGFSTFELTLRMSGSLGLDAPYLIEHAWDGQAGVNLFRTERFDVVLMDLQMPVLDGYDAVRQLRADGFASPILACTAFAMSEDRDECIRLGCDDFISKPIQWDRLMAKLTRLLTAQKVAAD